MGEQGAAAVEALLKNVNRPAQGIVATAVGIVALLVGAMSVFGELQDSLDRIWRAPAPPGGSSLLQLLRGRLLSFGMVFGIGFLVVVSLLASAALAALGKWWAPMFGGWSMLASAVDLVLGFAVVTAGFALIYKVVPRVRIQWRDVWVGAAVTALLFTLGRFAIGFYLGRATFASGFGAAASIVVLLVWVYYSAQIFLLGAEFTWIYAHAFGSLSPSPRSAGAANAGPVDGRGAAVAGRVARRDSAPRCRAGGRSGREKGRQGQRDASHALPAQPWRRAFRAPLRLCRARRHGRIGAPARRPRARGRQDAGDADRPRRSVHRPDARRPHRRDPRAGARTSASSRCSRARQRTPSATRGYLVGGTSPFGTRKTLPVYVEASALELPKILINGGRRGYLVGIAPDVLGALLGATPVHCAS